MPFDQVNFVLPAVKTDGALRILTEARGLVAAGWCRTPFSIDAEGNQNLGDLDKDGPLSRGVQFCADGALWRAYHIHGKDLNAKSKAVDLLDAEAVRAGYPDGRIWLNSGEGQAGVVAAFDRAIAARRAQVGG